MKCRDKVIYYYYNIHSVIFLQRKPLRWKHGWLTEWINAARDHVSSSFPFTYINLSIPSRLTIRLSGDFLPKLMTPCTTAQLYRMVQHNYPHLQNKSFKQQLCKSDASLLSGLSGCWWLPGAVGGSEEQMSVIHEVSVSSEMGLRLSDASMY